VLKYEIGDIVRIQSEEWLKARNYKLDNRMISYAGKTAIIHAIYLGVCDNLYILDIDDGKWIWQEWMFDPDYRKPRLLTDDEIAMLRSLCHRPPKRKRDMNRWEILAWANSDASRGWVVRSEEDSPWNVPQFFSYNMGTERYQRARLLSDLSGVDETSVQGFKVEE
jgi:hypothetical protein